MRLRNRCLAACLLAVAFAVLSPALAGASTFQVTTDSDSSSGTCLPASCTLRQAVAAANAGAGGDVIKVPAGLYTLAFGELQLQKSVTVQGAGAAATVLDGNSLSRVLKVAPGIAVAIVGVGVENGRVVSTSAEEAHGGGILNAGTLALEGTIVRGNEVLPATVSPGLIPAGGGIYNSGTLLISGSTIAGNHATTLPDAGGIPEGGGIANANGQVQIADSSLIGNAATSGVGAIPEGGAINSEAAVVHGASVSLTRVLVSGNRSIIAAPAGGVADAGGIFASRTDLTIRESTLSGNEAAGGSVASGGALVQFEGTFSLERTLVANNVVESEAIAEGGGLVLSSSATNQQTIANSTVTGNRVSLASENKGGGISHRGGAHLTVLSSTISGNVAAGTAAGDLGGNLLDSGASGSVLSLRDSIVSSGSAAAGAENCSGGGVQSEGHNIDSRNQCNLHAAGDKVSTDPLLAPLAANGGPTETMALLVGSPAIDAGDACLATDQRGVARPQGTACDIGAFELVPSARPPAPPGPASGAATLRFRSTKAKIDLKSGKGTVAVDCLNVAGDTCSVGLGLFAAPAGHKGGRAPKRRIQLGVASGSIDGGKTGALSVELTAKGLARLRGAKGHKLTAIATGQSANRLGQGTPVSQKLTLKGKRPKKK